MKKFIHASLVLAIALGLTFYSCKKNNTSTPTESTADQQQMAADEHNQNLETQNSMNEANDAMGTTGFGKTGAVYGATTVIDSPNKKITITYNGLNKDNSRMRTGQIVIQLTNGVHWKDAGAQISITYTNFKVTQILKQKSIVFDGMITVTNQSGGRVFVDPNVIHLATSTGFKITFDDGTQRTWNLSRKRTFANNSGVLSVMEEGNGSADGNNTLLAWGTNRKGDQFYTQIPTPIIYNTINSTTCPNNVMSGKKTHIVGGSQLSVTFGLDALGMPVTTGTCPVAYKVEWTGASGKQWSYVLLY